MQKTGIEYVDFSWSPIAMRCTPISAGCKNCWHLPLANRLSNNPNVSQEAQKAYAGEIGPLLIHSRLSDPLRRKKPAKIAVQFMGDLFHPDISFSVVDKILEAMIINDHHTYFLLTKRVNRMAKYFNGIVNNDPEVFKRIMNSVFYYPKIHDKLLGLRKKQPLENIIFGATVENQPMAKKRIYDLLEILGKHWLSLEPMLGPVNMTHVDHDWQTNALTGRQSDMGRPYIDTGKLDFVALGGESGHHARPMHPDWVRSVRDKCAAAGVPFMFKQWGALLPFGQHPNIAELPENIKPTKIIDALNTKFQVVSKKEAGRHIDGKEHMEMP